VTDSEGGSVAVLTAGLLYLGMALWYVREYGIVTDERSLAGGAEFFEALNLTVIAAVCVGLLYGGVWLYRADLRDEHKWRTALWCGAGLVGSTAVIAFMQTNWLLEGVAPPEEWLVQQYLVGSGTGGVAGLLVGVNNAAVLGSRRKVAAQRDSFKIINEFLRHHVLNGMQVVLGNTDLLREECDETGPERFETIETRTDAVVDLVQRVSVLMQSLAEETPLQPVELGAVVEREVDAARGRFPAARIDAEVPDDVTVLADQLLGDVLENVLENAVEHNPREEPRIEVSVTTRPETVTVAVADDGPGIPDERKTEVFEPGEPGPRAVGKGLGLYLADVLVRRYGGTIEATDRDGWERADEDPDDGSGTVLRITLDRA